MKKIYRIKNLDCANCANKIETALNKNHNIKHAEINFIAQTLKIEFFPKEDQILEEIKCTIQKLEPNVIIEKIKKDEKKESFIFFQKKFISIIFSSILFLIALFVSFPNFQINFILYLISYLVVGGNILIKALKNLKTKSFLDENFLMSIASIGAFLIGEYPEAVAVMLFYQIGEFFQECAINNSRKSITKLMDIRPDYAYVKQNNKLIKKSPLEVKIGEIVVVKPGEKIPLDGIIQKGKSFLDNLALTGESIPQIVKEGDYVFNGCINKESPLEVKVEKNYQDSTVSKILNLVENANCKKASSEKFITKFAKYYTPTVVILALLLAIVPPLLSADHNFVPWIYKALSFLVVSCPCALVISIPLSFFGGIGLAAKKGILIKGSNYLEDLSQATTLITDKTGTLTEGVFEVQKIETLRMSKQDLLRVVAHVEYYSNHPIALSIKKAYCEKIDTKLLKDVKEQSGKGITATFEEKNIIIGNEKLMNDYKIKFIPTHNVGTILYVAINKEYQGYIMIADKLKETTKTTIDNLKQHNVKNITMLTGDRKEIAEYTAKELKIDHYVAELLPHEKVQVVEEIMKKTPQNQKVIFIGDGINDAPVLMTADIGIAMGGIGSDAAIEASDIVFMTDDFSKLITAKKISIKTLKIVKQNIVLAITIKVLVLFFSAIGISTMWEAVFADVGVSILAVLNALRLLKMKKM